MSYNILPTKEFSKDLAKIGNQFRDRVKKKVEEVAQDPTRYKHLHYELSGSCRIWIGKLRVIFSHNQALHELYLEKIVFDHEYN